VRRILGAWTAQHWPPFSAATVRRQIARKPNQVAAESALDMAVTKLADEETALGADRLNGELAKAISQTRFYRDVAVEAPSRAYNPLSKGSYYLGVAIEYATDGALASTRLHLPI
jgi:hypothetical protein